MPMVGDEEMEELALEELKLVTPQVSELEVQLKMLLLPKDPLDTKNIVLEVNLIIYIMNPVCSASVSLTFYSCYLPCTPCLPTFKSRQQSVLLWSLTEVLW